MTLKCSKCQSLLLVKFGEVSPLDGMKNYLCLKCGADLAPPRSRFFLRMLLVIGLVAPVALAAFAAVFVSSITFWSFFPIACIADAITCVIIFRAIRRLMRLPTPERHTANDFPDPKVRLTELTVRLDSDFEKVQGWMTPLSAFVESVFQAAGEALKENGASGKVRLFVKFSFGRRLVKVGYRGQIRHDCLNLLFEHAQNYPMAEFGDGKVSFEAWFRVYP